MNRCLSLIALLVALGVTHGATAAGKFDKQASAAAAERRDAVTVYVDANWGSRKKGAAKDLNEAHRSFQAAGYELIGVEPHTENGDLEGFFVSYRRRER